VAGADPHVAFAQEAARDGVELRGGAFDWLSEQGHVGFERVAKARRDPAIVAPARAAIEILGLIFARLRGDVTVLAASRENLLLPVDLVHEPSGTLIQVDGLEHFTSVRLTALDLYPAEAALGFDVSEYRRLCRELAPSSDPIARGMPAKAFGFGGVQRERAYHDSLFDLTTPAMGHPPLIRAAATDGDGAAAYRRVRDVVIPLSGGGDRPTRP
jgi:hypothetical protein